MIDNIKILHGQIHDKMAFNAMVAEDFKMEARSVANHWFCGYWAIPKSKQPRVVELLQNAIKEQNNITA